MSLKKLIKTFFKLNISLLMLPLIMLIRLIKPICLIRFGNIRDDRIGHFIADSAEKIALKKLNKNKKIIDLYWTSHKPINKVWAKLIKNYLNISYLYRFLSIANDFIIGGEEHSTNSSNTGSRDIFGYYYKFDCKVEFTEKQKNSGLKLLKNYGWDGKKKIVSLNIRDNIYLKSINKKIDWGYHNYRNCEIRTFRKSVSWLIDQGYFVIRTGNLAKNKININNNNFLDYPFCKDKNSLFDLLLPSFSSYWIGSGFGLDEIPKLYKIPILYINFLPISSYNFYNDSETAPKKLIWNDTGKSLNVYEYMQNSYNKIQEYKEKNIRIVDLDEKEILEIIKDFFFRKRGNLNKEKREERFFKIYKKFYLKNYSSKHLLYKHINSRINLRWLEISNKSFFPN